MAGASILPCSRSSATSCCAGTSSSSPIAVVIGAAFGAVVTAFVASFITPLIAAIGGKPDFSALAFTINGSRFTYGAFFNALLSFLIIAAVIFFFVVRPLNALMARLKPEPAGRPRRPAVPGVPVGHPGGGPSLRVLHRGGPRCLTWSACASRRPTRSRSRGGCGRPRAARSPSRATWWLMTAGLRGRRGQQRRRDWARIRTSTPRGRSSPRTA